MTLAEVVSMGARGPLGLSRTAVAMALRANKLEPHATSFRDRRDQEIGVALTGGLGSRLFGFHRMVALAAPALAEAAFGAPDELQPTEERPWPVIVCLPEEGRADDSKRFTEELMPSLSSTSGVAIDAERSSTLRLGHAGFAQAVRDACDLLREGAPAVCVGGVDSYYHPQVLTELDRAFRLHALGADDGFIPGEGGAFLLLKAEGRKKGGHGAILAAEVGAEETATREDEPNLATAMTDLLEAAQKRAPADWAITDVNGERHRYREWSRARARNRTDGAEDLHWVWETGDVGAASGALFSTIALSLCELGCAPFDRAMIALHSDGPSRGVVTIEGAAHHG